MTSFILACLLLVLAVIGVIVRKTYYCLPVHELKRRAESRDPVASELYRAAAYGSSLRALLWLIIALTTAVGFVLLARVAPVWLSLPAVIGLLWVAYSWLPASRVTSFNVRLTVIMTPAIAWLLNYLYPLIDRVAGLVKKYYSAAEHTGLFERSDLMKLIEQQEHQKDSRFSREELEMAKRALGFDDRTAADILTPAEQIKTVLSNDVISPVLINELYEQDQTFVLVRESADGPVVGTLDSKRLELRTTGLVRDFMQPTVYYLHEKDSLSEALRAFFATNSSLLTVVSGTGDYLGVISLQNMLHQLLGDMPEDVFDQYTDLEAVAARHTPVRQVVQPEDTEEEVVELA